MSDILSLIQKLKSNNPNNRYEACEELRVMTIHERLTQEAIDALTITTNDPNPDVADSAQRALALHNSYMKSDEVFENLEDNTAKDSARANAGPDTAIGFFGWVIFHNLYFLAGVEAFSSMTNVERNVFTLLPFLTGLLVVIFMKRVRMGVGSGIAILLSILLWILFSEPWLIFFSLPAGVVLLMG